MVHISGDWIHKLLFIEATEEDCEIMGGLFTPSWGESESHTSNLEDYEEALAQVQPELVIINTLAKPLDLSAIIQNVRALCRDCFVAFITERLSQQDRLDLYEQGADDIIEKPYDPIDTHFKIIAELKNIGLRRQLRQQLDEASNTAHAVLSSYAETGTIIEFFKTLVGSKDYDGAGIALLRSADQFGLRCTLQIHGVNGVLNFRCENHSAEAEIMSRCFNKGYVIDGNGRLSIKRNSTCLLVKNLPFHDEDLYGRLKDHLYTMASATDDHISVLHEESQIQEERTTRINRLVDNTRINLDIIRDHFSAYDSLLENRMHDFKSNFESVIWGLGLESDQEEALIESIDTFYTDMMSNKEIQSLITASFKQIVQDIDRCQ